MFAQWGEIEVSYEADWDYTAYAEEAAYNGSNGSAPGCHGYIEVEGLNSMTIWLPGDITIEYTKEQCEALYNELTLEEREEVGNKLMEQMS